MFLTKKNSDKIVTFFLLLWQVVDIQCCFFDVCAGEETAFGPCVPKKGL